MFSRPGSSFRRALALFLCAQPVLWMNNVALAQAIDSQAAELRSSQQPTQDQPSELQKGPEWPGLRRSLEGDDDLQRGLDRTQGRGQPQLGPQGQQPPTGPLTTGGTATPLPLAVDEPIDPARYVLGPGDVLELHFWGVENFRLRVTVDLQGRAFVAKVGYLPLAGKTLTEAEEVLRRSVARYFPKLDFGLTLAQPRTFVVQVADDVVRPGPQPARAIDRVSTVIARAGGLAPGGSLRRIEIRRRDGAVVRADLLLYSITGDVKHNPYVLDGDVVRVPFEVLVATVRGAVNRPGTYELVGSSDLAELLELAGGLAPGATKELPISIVRRVPEEKLKRLSFDFLADGTPPVVPISAQDTVRFPAFSELQQSVTITGALAGVAASTVGVAGSRGGGGEAGTSRGTVASDEAAATRRLPYAQGDTVHSILERVGGPGPLADLRNSYILRDNQAVPVDLYAVEMLRDFSADRPVQLGDTVVVPFRRQSVLIEGAVFKPGAYPYNPTYGVGQYLALAGGLNRFAKDVDSVYLVTPSGEMKEFSPELKVEPGASLVVPERDFSRTEVVTLILAGAGLLLSAATIFLTLRK